MKIKIDVLYEDIALFASTDIREGIISKCLEALDKKYPKIKIVLQQIVSFTPNNELYLNHIEIEYRFPNAQLEWDFERCK